MKSGCDVEDLIQTFIEEFKTSSTYNIYADTLLGFETETFDLKGKLAIFKPRIDCGATKILLKTKFLHFNLKVSVL